MLHWKHLADNENRSEKLGHIKIISDQLPKQQKCQLSEPGDETILICQNKNVN